MTDPSSPVAGQEYPIPQDLVPWDFLVKSCAYNEITGCILWLGPTDPEGYGFFSVEGRRYLAHRVGYTLAKGVIPEGLTLDHLCVNPRCVNPEHLEPVTRGENNARGIGRPLYQARARGPYGPRDPEKGYSKRQTSRLNKAS